MLTGMLTVACGSDSLSRVVLIMNLTMELYNQMKTDPCDLPILPKHESGRDGDLPLSGVVRHGDEELVVVMVLVPDDDPHSSSSLGPDHLGDEGALPSLDESQPAPDLLVVLYEPAGLGREGGHQGNTSQPHFPPRGKHCRVGLQDNMQPPDCRYLLPCK